MEQAGDEDLITDIDSTQYKRKLLRTGAGDRDQLGFKPANQLPEMMGGTITPMDHHHLGKTDANKRLGGAVILKSDEMRPLTDEEAKFSTYQFES